MRPSRLRAIAVRRATARAGVLLLGLCASSNVVAATGSLMLGPRVLPVAAAATSGASTRGVVFFSIRVAPDYATSHLLVAGGTQLGCSSSCSRLFVSRDGGASWSVAAAHGWNGGDPLPADTPRGPALVASNPDTLQTSWDGGADFSTLPAPAGAIDVWSDGHDARAVVVDSGDRWHEVTLASGAVQDVPGAAGTLQTGSGIYVQPGAPSGSTAGLAAGQSVTSNHPAVARCTADWRCDTPSDVAPVSEGMLVQASTAFTADRGVFAYSLQGGPLYRSVDAGRSFAAHVVAPASTGVVATVQRLAFSADFDAVAPRGTAYAAVAGVAQQVGAQPAAVGGVYVSGDGGISWRHLGPPSELDNDTTTVAVTPDGHVLAAFVDSQQHTAGLLCTADGTTWAPSCPASSAAQAAASAPGAPAGVPARPGASLPGALGGTSTPGSQTAGTGSGGAGAQSARARAPVGRASGSGGGTAALVIAIVLAVLAAGGGAAYVRLRRHRSSRAGAP